MGPGISHRQKVMCPILNGRETFAIIYDRTYNLTRMWRTSLPQPAEVEEKLPG